MKKLLFLFVIIGSLLSCGHDDANPESQFDSEKFPQKWQLVAVQGSSIANSPVETGSYGIFYILNADNTISKTGEINGLTKTINGKYIFKEVAKDKYLEITYDADDELIENCYSTPVEELYVKSDSELLGTSAMCDRPKLWYRRVE